MSKTWIRGCLSAIAVLICMNSKMGAQPSSCETQCEEGINVLLHITPTGVVPMTDQWGKVQPACSLIVRSIVPDGDGVYGTATIQFRRIINPTGGNCCGALDNPGTANDFDGTCQSFTGTTDPSVTYDIVCAEECVES